YVLHAGEGQPPMSYSKEHGFVERPDGPKPDPKIPRGATPEQAFDALHGNVPGSPLDRWVLAAADAIEATGNDKTGLKAQLMRGKAPDNATPAEQQAAALARKKVIVDHLLEGMNGQPLAEERKAKDVRRDMKGRIDLDAVVAELPFDKAKEIFDSMAPGDKGNTYEAWELENMRKERVDQRVAEARSRGEQPNVDEIRARVEEEIAPHTVDIGNPRTREVATKEAKARFKHKGIEPTQAQLDAEVTEILTNRKPDIVEQVDGGKGIRMKELKSTGEGLTRDDAAQIFDTL